mgnify:CR=1 FL=1
MRVSLFPRLHYRKIPFQVGLMLLDTAVLIEFRLRVENVIEELITIRQLLQNSLRTLESFLGTASLCQAVPDLLDLIL